MKKSILLAALLTVSAANAQETQFKWSGGIDVDYESTSNFDWDDSINDRKNDFVQTTKLTLDIQRSENLFGKITLRNVALWGDTAGYHRAETAYKSENTNSNIFLVEEAYGVWKLNDVSTLQFGRGSFELANGELVSKEGKGLIAPISFDGLLLSNEFEPTRMSLFLVRAVDETFNYDQFGRTETPGNSDAHFFGVVFDIKNLPEFLNKTNVHYIGAKSNSARPTGGAFPNNNFIPKNERSWIGLSIGGETGAFDYAASYENFQGEITDVNLDREGDMFNVEAGFNMPEAKGFRVGLTYHQSSGDKAGTATESEAYDSFNYDQLKYTGRMGVARWGNGLAATAAQNGTGLTAMGVKLKAEPTEGLKVMVDYYMFNETEKAGTDDEIGSELDIVLEKEYANGFHTSLEYDMFMPGDDLGDDDAELILVNAGFTF